MRLYELDNSDEAVNLAIAMDQLKTDVETGTIDYSMPVDEFLDYLAEFDVIIDPDDLLKIVKVPPLSTVIHNANASMVEFKGKHEKDDSNERPDNDANTIKQMAKRAMK